MEVNSRINSILAISEEKVWIGTENGLFLAENNTLKRIRQFDSLNITSLCADNQNRVWLVAENELYTGQKTFNGNSLFEKSKLLNQLEIESENQIKCLFQDKKGNTWLGFSNSAPFVFNGINLVKVTDQFSELNINCVAEDHRGNIWLGTEYSGIIILRKENEKWKIVKELNPETGFWLSKVNSILFLNENTCLLGSNRGINKINLDSDENIISQKKSDLLRV
ncbi:MAG: hypothetical protein HC831_02050 [Chloroflexia bacterium]|nr:hypothetical protein [Chloroflexia bacterium]